MLRAAGAFALDASLLLDPPASALAGLSSSLASCLMSFWMADVERAVSVVALLPAPVGNALFRLAAGKSWAPLAASAALSGLALAPTAALASKEASVAWALAISGWVVEGLVSGPLVLAADLPALGMAWAARSSAICGSDRPCPPASVANSASSAPSSPFFSVSPCRSALVLACPESGAAFRACCPCCWPCAACWRPNIWEKLAASGSLPPGAASARAGAGTRELGSAAAIVGVFMPDPKN